MRTVEEIFGKVLGISPRKISDKTSQTNTKDWDSFNGLTLLNELEKTFKIRFTSKEMITVKNIGDIKRILKKRGIRV